MRPSHLFVLLLIVLLLFGAQKLPELARALGKSARILKEEANELTKDSTTPQPHTNSSSTSEN